jgi:Protein of unknown function (DUF2480)
MDAIVNRVTESGLLTLDLSSYLPNAADAAEFDIKPFLFREMILKEKDYRAALQQNNWEAYHNKHVAIFCSADAIVPVWAYMLAATYLQGIATSVYFGTSAEMNKQLLLQQIEQVDAETYRDKRVVIKGCGDISIPDEAYVAMTFRLKPVVKSIMYGEPCSTVPVYKKAKAE